MACLAPGVQLTQEEQACCREMAEQCGSAGIAADHSCCQKVVSVEQVAIVTQFAGSGHAVAPAAIVAVQFDSVIPTPQEFGGRPPLGRHPPPASAPTRDVLRI